MFNKNTVFVLGAGASSPYEYPTAFELQELVKSFLNNIPDDPTETYYVLQGKDTYDPKLWKTLGYSIKDMNIFYEDLCQAATYSIDKFLERRPDHIALGKLLIAFILKQREYSHTLRIRLKETNWYADLVNKIDLAPENISEIKLAFITFNYDRSLEFFLYNMLRTRTMDPQKALEAFEKIKIVHIYGGFGNYPWEKEGIAYDGTVSVDILNKFAKGIKIMSDERDTEELSYASKLIEQADHLYFLGFGYDEDNLRRIHIPYKGNLKANVAGTAFGLSESERNRVLSYFNIYLTNERQTIMNFLDNIVVYD